MQSTSNTSSNQLNAESPVLFGSYDTAMVSAYDELPLWSAPFGLKLLDVINYTANTKMLDIGCATGFPLIEISQRLGSTAQCFGIDPWEKAISRLKEKINTLQLKNITLYDCKSEEMPFENNYFNLIVSNNGLNNTQNEEKVLNECFRTAAVNAQLVISANLPGTFSLFYEVLTELLLENGYFSVIESLIEHIRHKRKSIKEQCALITKAGFTIKNVYEEKFTIKCINGTAFLNHSFIRRIFVNEWIQLLQPTQCVEKIVSEVENRLNKISQSGSLQMEVPFVVIDSFKS